MDRTRPRGVSLAVSDPHADVDVDARWLVAGALDRGAARAQILAAPDVALDPSAPANAHGEACSCPDNLMAPPFAPAPEEFSRWLGGFDVAILAEVETPWAGPEPWRQGGPGWRCRWRGIRDDPALRADTIEAWRSLHGLTMWLEREAMRRGYYLSVGFGAVDCELCEICDTSQLCVEPYAARPSIEAVGVDVDRTREAAGWAPTLPDRLTLTGLALLV